MICESLSSLSCLSIPQLRLKYTVSLSHYLKEVLLYSDKPINKIYSQTDHNELELLLKSEKSVKSSIYCSSWFPPLSPYILCVASFWLVWSVFCVLCVASFWLVWSVFCVLCVASLWLVWSVFCVLCVAFLWIFWLQSSQTSSIFFFNSFWNRLFRSQNPNLPLPKEFGPVEVGVSLQIKS